MLPRIEQGDYGLGGRKSLEEELEEGEVGERQVLLFFCVGVFRGERSAEDGKCALGELGEENVESLELWAAFSETLDSLIGDVGKIQL